jgi:surfeit locus 1 family protein
MSNLKRLFRPRWLIATLIVLVGMGVCIRLGAWQLDRLEKRRAFNARVSAQVDQTPLELEGAALAADLYDMEYRPVQVTGSYDHAQQVALQNQSWGNELGVHLLTPLVISGTNQAILVDRGWIPQADFEAGALAQYDEPGLVAVQGVLRRPQAKAEIGGRTDPTPAPGQARRAWYFANVEQISRQVTHPLLPVYLQQAPTAGQSEVEGPPYRSQPKLELSEGPHMGYALQWFSFAMLLAIGYPFYIRRQLRQGESQ